MNSGNAHGSAISCQLSVGISLRVIFYNAKGNFGKENIGNPQVWNLLHSANLFAVPPVNFQAGKTSWPSNCFIIVLYFS